jgi:hypothetical protein
VIRSSTITFNKLEKGNTINLRFRDKENTLLDRKLKIRPKNKLLRLEEQKTVLKLFKQFKDYDINPIECRLIISIKVSKKSII